MAAGESTNAKGGVSRQSEWSLVRFPCLPLGYTYGTAVSTFSNTTREKPKREMIPVRRIMGHATRDIARSYCDLVARGRTRRPDTGIRAHSHTARSSR